MKWLQSILGTLLIVGIALILLEASRLSPVSAHAQDDPETHSALMYIDGERAWIDYEVFEGEAYSGNVHIGSHWNLQFVTYSTIARELVDLGPVPQDNRDFSRPAERLKREAGRFDREIYQDFPPAPPPPPKDTAYWPDGVIPYIFDGSLTDIELRAAVAEAARIWTESDSGFVIRPFDASRDKDRPLLTIYDARDRSNDQWRKVTASSPYCRSELGYMSIQQPSRMWLTPSCADEAEGVTSTGRLLHEFAHVIGLMHENQRGDRVLYFDGNWRGSRNLDYRVFAATDLKFALIGDYDPCSITHYPQDLLGYRDFQLSERGRQTFDQCAARLPPDCRMIGQRCQLTEGDVAAARAIFEFERRRSW